MNKEQVIIGGVDVSKCRYFCGYDDLCKNDNIGRVVRPLCKRIPDCYFKQLARKTQEYNTCHTELVSVSDQLKKKTQECEELKETLNSLTRGVVMPMAESEVIDLTDRYRKALEEIEKIIKEYDCVNCSEQHCEDCNKGEIFYIINKAKGEGC